jgi:spermidine synthase
MCSGACALIYQVAWLRELHLVFGSTTAASAAVVAIFMCGLGIGNAVLGKKADKKQNPLRFYAQLEFCISVLVALTPLLIDVTRWAYISMGGQIALGASGATLIRLAFSAIVILLPTILMGGTLPAAVASVTTSEDLNRRAVGMLYGFNTLGAVAGTLISTFLLLSWLGTRMTLWGACCLNLTVAALAGLLSRSVIITPDSPSGILHVPSYKTDVGPRPEKEEVHPRFYTYYVYASAGIVGFGFMLMELVWYRMLAPILGGTTFTFGLILAVALLGIGIGGAIYPLLFDRRFSPSLSVLSFTCALEAVFIAVPYALGDKLAYQGAFLHAINSLGFFGEILGWSVTAFIVVLPASIISGVQFPLLIALLGQAKQDVGKQLGYTYVANTSGCIVGSLAGGFGLLPFLSAPGAWRLVVVILVALSVALMIFTYRWRTSIRPMMRPLIISLIALLLVSSTGPTAIWRHSGIGLGHAHLPMELTPNNIRKWENNLRRAVVWQADGVEAGVAINVENGVAFYVNGKCDGNAILDAETQVALGILPALLHSAPKTCFVVGMGTGETAGWLAAVNSVKSVDVVEIEPAIMEVARRCASVNCGALTNPKVQLTFNDAREVLLTTNNKYDIIVSEPSNPYRAGISNLFTREFYLSVDALLNRGGMFAQWLQGYEIDETAVSTVIVTLKSVFKSVEVWQTRNNDMLLVCSQDPLTYDFKSLRDRMRQEPFRSGFAAAWRATQIEGLVARYVGGDVFTSEIARKHTNLLNTDDLNRLEYGFSRTLGRPTDFTILQLRKKAMAISADRPNIRGAQIDWEGVEDERMAMYVILDHSLSIPSGASTDQVARGHALQRYLDNNYADTVKEWESQPKQAAQPTEMALLALAYAELGNSKAEDLINRLQSFNEVEASLIRGILLSRQGRNQEAFGVFSHAFVALRSNPWPLVEVTEHAFKAAVDISPHSSSEAQKLLRALEQPFAAEYLEAHRKWLGWCIASQFGTKTMLPWIESYEPNVPWTEMFLQRRVQAYSATRNALQARAESDLKLFLDQENRKN